MSVVIRTRAIMEGERIAAETELADGIDPSDLPMLELMLRGRHVEMMAEMAAERRDSKKRKARKRR